MAVWSTTSLAKILGCDRIDGEYFLPIYLENDRKLDSIKTFSLPEKFFVSDGNHMTVSHWFSDSGDVPYYRGQDVNDFFLENATPVKIPHSIYDSNLMKRSHFREGDVLLSIVGTIGSLSVVPHGIGDATGSCKIAILRKKSPYSPFALAAFLATKFGQLQIKRNTRGAVQMGLILRDLSKIRIPDLSDKVLQKVDILIQEAIKKNHEARISYSSAEELLSSALKEGDLKLSHPLSYTAKFSDIMRERRTDAEYYQPKYDEYFAKIKKYPGGISKVSNHFKQNKDTIKFTLPEYNYIEIGDINIGNGEATFNLLPTEDLPANAKHLVKRGDILISKVRPYRGAVSVIDFEPENLIASGAFTILRETGDVKKEVLVILLRTPIYRDWLLKWNVGSSYPVIKDEDVLNLTIPIIRRDIQEQIAAKVQESFALRKESKHLLDLAKHAVEIAIEQGEDAAQKILDSAFAREQAILDKYLQ